MAPGSDNLIPFHPVKKKTGKGQKCRWRKHFVSAGGGIEGVLSLFSFPAMKKMYQIMALLLQELIFIVKNADESFSRRLRCQ
jgi:hypothetical protein